MILNGITFPAPNWGYTTRIEFPFSFSKLSNGSMNAYDPGQQYDKYSCTGTFIFTGPEMDSFYNIYNNTNRGESIKLQAGDGFFPFSIAVDQPLSGFDVYIVAPNSKGMKDDIGKSYEIKLKFIWAYTTAIVFKLDNSSYCKEGDLTFLTNSDIRYPSSGFKPKQQHSVAVQDTKGGQVYGFNNPNDLQENLSGFTLTLRGDILQNLVNKLINSFRSTVISIEGGDNYFIFTRSEGDNTAFNVKINDNIVKIKHKNFENFDIDFSLTKV